MGCLKIALLGPPQVDHRGLRLSFPDRKVLALLAYLAAERGVHERQKITRLLWSESDMAHGRTALRITLLHLRHILEEDVAPDLKSHLLITHNTLGLDLTSGLDLDLQTLDETWMLTHDLMWREGVLGEVRRTLIARLQHAVGLYRGCFLQDFSLRNSLDFDNWVCMQQGYWYQRIEQIFDWLSQLQKEEGMLEQAIATVECWQSFDPLNEDITIRLMQLQFANGNRIAALKTYETYVDILMTELCAKPSPNLVNMAEMLRKATPPRVENKGIRRCSSSERPLLDIPFVGRRVEFSRLMTLYERVCCGEPQVALLEGEAGIGKTRLAVEFLDWVKAQGADVLEGRAYQTSLCLSYQPLLEALRTRFEQAQNLHQLLPNPWLIELSRLLPDLRKRYPELPPPSTDQPFITSRLLEALAYLTKALASQAPLLIFIDDIQWLDAATLDVFQYLARFWMEQQVPTLLLLSRRIETREMDQKISQWLASLRGTISLTRLELGSLSEKDVQQIVHSFSSVVGGQPKLQGCTRDTSKECNQPVSQHVQACGISLGPERFGTWLFAETNGQPFYLKSLLQILIERGVLVPRLIKGSGWVFEPHPSLLEITPPDNILPTEVREMIQNRLTRLSSSCRNLLIAGAVLGQNFTFEELCQVTQLVPQQGLAALEEALDNLLLLESSHQREGRNEVSYHFAHTMIRRVVYAMAGDARKRFFQSRVYGPESCEHSRRSSDSPGVLLPISRSLIKEETYGAS
jgi:DNA-binding SARP family transcriptional activator